MRRRRLAALQHRPPARAVGSELRPPRVVEVEDVHRLSHAAAVGQPRRAPRPRVRHPRGQHAPRQAFPTHAAHVSQPAQLPFRSLISYLPTRTTYLPKRTTSSRPRVPPPPHRASHRDASRTTVLHDRTTVRRAGIYMRRNLNYSICKHDKAISNQAKARRSRRVTDSQRL